MLKPIERDQLIFDSSLGNVCTPIRLELDDSDWRNYSLETLIKTEALGVLAIRFDYYGSSQSSMTVHQTLSNGATNDYTYSYDTKLFQKYVGEYLNLVSTAWCSVSENNERDGEDIVIDFYNEVLSKGRESTK